MLHHRVGGFESRGNRLSISFFLLIFGVGCNIAYKRHGHNSVFINGLWVIGEMVLDPNQARPLVVAPKDLRVHL